MANQNVIAFSKVSLPYGWLGNMSPHPVVYENDKYATAEALFQCLRFDDEAIRNEIMRQASPMSAKMIAKKHRAKMILSPHHDQDLENMCFVLMLKIEQHPKIRMELQKTGDALITEDCSKRKYGSGLFWGAALIDGKWEGQNALGKMWMELREEICCGKW